MSNSYINISVQVFDVNGNIFKAFPLQYNFVGESSKIKICDDKGICSFKLKIGTQFKVEKLTVDDIYTEAFTLDVQSSLNGKTIRIELLNAINDYLSQTQFKVLDIDKKPVPRAKISVTYLNRTYLKEFDEDGKLLIKTLIGESFKFQLVNPITMQPLEGTHIDEFTATRMKGMNIIINQNSKRLETDLTVNKPTTVTKPPIINDMITTAQMREMWTSRAVTEDMLRPILDELNKNLKIYRLDTKLRKAHFFAQVMQEIGPKFILREEVWRYSSKNLKNIFSYYAKRSTEADYDGSIQDRRRKEQIIADKIYWDANRPKGLKLGNVIAGDGYKFIGRGLKQTTGRDNYTTLNNMYPTIWQDDNVNFLERPELLEQPKYAVRSAIVFWLSKKLYELADTGATDEVVNSITTIINRNTGEESRAGRRANFRITRKTFA